MNILKKIQTKNYENSDLIKNIDLNPIVSYHIIKEIVNNEIRDEVVINKLKEISNRLTMSDSVLGPICLGHVSLVALKKLGVDCNEVEKNTIISKYDWEIVEKFYRENEW